MDREGLRWRERMESPFPPRVSFHPWSNVDTEWARYWLVESGSWVDRGWRRSIVDNV